MNLTHLQFQDFPFQLYQFKLLFLDFFTPQPFDQLFPLFCQKKLKPYIQIIILGVLPQYLGSIQKLLTMLSDDSGFNSIDDQSFKDQEFKKIDYKGVEFNSGQSYDSLQDSQSKKISRLVKKNISNKSFSVEDKSKIIKKNRQSAKMSRLRKKQYQQKLEQRVLELQNQISQRKTNIKNISDKIFYKFSRSNKDKYKYLTEKLSSSKNLLSLVNQIKNLKQPVCKELKLSSTKSADQQKNDLVKTQDNPTITNHINFENVNLENIKQQASKVKHRKKKCRHLLKKGEEKEEDSKQEMQQKINQKQSQLQMSLKNYMYEFGMKGCLRTDVIQRSKYEWLQALNASNPQPTQQVCNGVAKMKSCLQKLQNKSKLLDFHLRQLRAKVKNKYAVQFMLDRQFFAYNSETIYKNTQFKGGER